MQNSLYTKFFPEFNDIIINLPFLGIFNLKPIIQSAIIFIILSFIFWVIKFIILKRLKKLSKKTSTDMDDVFITTLSNIKPLVYTLIALYIALLPFIFSPLTEKIIKTVLLVAVIWQVINILLTFIEYGARRLIEKDEDNDGEIDPNTKTVSEMVRLVAGIVLWVLGFVFLLSNIGIEVTSLVAGLGIGGVAIAFALQGVLGDLFASFSIYFDQPFRIGDFIIIGKDSGHVEKIGIKSTRIRTLQGEQLVVSNAELTSTRVQNFKRMDERRIVTQFGITYETSKDKVKEVNNIVESIFTEIEGLRFDRSHFTTFADSALIFEVVYFVQSSEYEDYLNIQQKFNFELMEKFAANGIDFAYPTQTVYQYNKNI